MSNGMKATVVQAMQKRADEPKWTPGPWAVREDAFGVQVYPTRDGPPDFGEWASLATIEDCYDEEEQETAANAHLIAAAPDMYEALYRLVTDCKIAGLEAQAGFDCWISMADEALAKARGETP